MCALGDPDERVNGRGLATLEGAGVSVTTGVCESSAAAINRGFLLNRTSTRPLVTLKLAISMDGYIATASGESRWITGPEARRYGHMLRATHDAILVGSGTARADDPELTCRIGGLEHQSPIRIVMDTPFDPDHQSAGPDSDRPSAGSLLRSPCGRRTAASADRCRSYGGRDRNRGIRAAASRNRPRHACSIRRHTAVDRRRRQR